MVSFHVFSSPSGVVPPRDGTGSAGRPIVVIFLWRLCAVALLGLLLAGCANNPLYRQWQPQLELQPTIVELDSVPFYPQKAYQCGPAALATVLSWAGRDIQPDALTDQLFIDGRKGSLQVEMLAASRRYGFVPYEHSRGLKDLLAQLEAGVPVVVLQNLGLGWAPAWHYAVVVGFDAHEQEFLLRSGPDRLRRTDSREFARTWRYSQQWMMTLHPAGQIPLGAEPLDYVSAVSGLERVQRHAEALASYRAAVEHWPQSFIAWMALGNSFYQTQNFAEAERAYRTAHHIDVEHPSAVHNLAWALIQQGKHQQALPYAHTAAGLSRDPRYRSALEALGG